MARGWESKSVESQMESAATRRSEPVIGLSVEQAQVLRQRESLELSRTRILHDLEKAVNPRYRDQLKAALLHLDQKLSQ
jgi:hypothetical protein